MAETGKMLNEIKWANRQRLQFIEIIAFYTGVVSRGTLARAFGISDAAATKDLKFYNDIAPGNLTYRHAVFGFVPARDFQAVFADLSPARVLPMIESNLTGFEGPYGERALFEIPTADLNLPKRLPDQAVLAQITRAIAHHKKLEVSYRSLSGKDIDHKRLIEPHALVNTGFRWHVRAYNEDSFDFRDFVLSRFVAAECLEIDAESSAQYDDDWSEWVSLALAPHPGLGDTNRQSLLIDYGASGETITIRVRRALIGYLLQQLSVDTTRDHSMNPRRHQLVVVNRDEIEPFASWAFNDPA